MFSPIYAWLRRRGLPTPLALDISALAAPPPSEHWLRDTLAEVGGLGKYAWIPERPRPTCNRPRPGTARLTSIHDPRDPVAKCRNRPGEPRLVRELVEQGASAYLPKTASLRVLVAAVRAVSRDEGGKVPLSLPSETLERVDRGPESKLTDRELEVLVLVARGSPPCRRVRRVGVP